LLIRLPPVAGTANIAFRAITFSPDGRLLARAIGGIVQTWDVESQSVSESFEYPGQDDRCAMPWTADGKHLVLCCANNKLVVLDPRSGKEVQTIEELPLGCILKKEGTLYVWAEKCGVVRAFDIPNNQLLGTILNLRDYRWLSLTPDGHYQGSAGIEKDIVYAATTDAGEQMALSPEEFEKRFGWKNDPSKVKLTPAE
jgi:WD40 repeat protein